MREMICSARSGLRISWVFLVVLSNACGDDRESRMETTGEPEPIVDVRQQLEQGTVQQKAVAAARLAVTDTIPATERVQYLMYGLERELAAPTTDHAPVASFLSGSDWLRHRYTVALGLVATADEQIVRDAIGGSTGELSERLILARGYADQVEAAPDLRRLLTEAVHPDVRTDAAFLLGELGDTSAIAELTGALNDPHHLTVERAGHPSEIYPVRQQAFSALLKLGVDVVFNGPGSYTVRQ